MVSLFESIINIVAINVFTMTNCIFIKNLKKKLLNAVD